MKRRAVVFAEPGAVEIREEEIPAPGPGEVLVKTLVSGISAGTEMLFYRGQVPRGMAVDETIAALGGEVCYPLKYGYAAVGRVTRLGEGVPPDWLGAHVFAFHPHESHFTAAPADLLRLPGGVTPEAAAFLPNMETAVTLVLDGQPLLGERVAVFGQGVVGLLVTALLGQMPLERLITVDAHAQRRMASLRLGATASFDPAHADLPGDADLTFELSGVPEALDAAIGATGYSGRVVIGSWYGEKRAALDLGGRFHRSRITLISSQVSTIHPALRGRWSPERRYDVAWHMIRRVRPEQLVTHRFPVEQAAEAYALLAREPGRAIQVVLTYA